MFVTKKKTTSPVLSKSHADQVKRLHFLVHFSSLNVKRGQDGLSQEEELISCLVVLCVLVGMGVFFSIQV